MSPTSEDLERLLPRFNGNAASIVWKYVFVKPGELRPEHKAFLLSHIDELDVHACVETLAAWKQEANDPAFNRRALVLRIADSIAEPPQSAAMRWLLLRKMLGERLPNDDYDELLECLHDRLDADTWLPGVWEYKGGSQTFQQLLRAEREVRSRPDFEKCESLTFALWSIRRDELACRRELARHCQATGIEQREYVLRVALEAGATDLLSLSKTLPPEIDWFESPSGRSFIAAALSWPGVVRREVHVWFIEQVLATGLRLVREAKAKESTSARRSAWRKLSSLFPRMDPGRSNIVPGPAWEDAVWNAMVGEGLAAELARCSVDVGFPAPWVEHVLLDDLRAGRPGAFERTLKWAEQLMSEGVSVAELRDVVLIPAGIDAPTAPELNGVRIAIEEYAVRNMVCSCSVPPDATEEQIDRLLALGEAWPGGLNVARLAELPRCTSVVTRLRMAFEKDPRLLGVGRWVEGFLLEHGPLDVGGRPPCDVLQLAVVCGLKLVRLAWGAPLDGWIREAMNESLRAGDGATAMTLLREDPSLQDASVANALGVWLRCAQWCEVLERVEEDPQLFAALDVRAEALRRARETDSSWDRAPLEDPYAFAALQRFERLEPDERGHLYERMGCSELLYLAEWLLKHGVTKQRVVGNVERWAVKAAEPLSALQWLAEHGRGPQELLALLLPRIREVRYAGPVLRWLAPHFASRNKFENPEGEGARLIEELFDAPIALTALLNAIVLSVGDTSEAPRANDRKSNRQGVQDGVLVAVGRAIVSRAAEPSPDAEDIERALEAVLTLDPPVAFKRELGRLRKVCNGNNDLAMLLRDVERVLDDNNRVRDLHTVLDAMLVWQKKAIVQDGGFPSSRDVL